MTGKGGGADGDDGDKPLYVTNPERWVEETVHGADLACIVIFRGSWCKYDRHYLRKLGQHLKSMTGGGGGGGTGNGGDSKKKKKSNVVEKVKLIAWTSEGSDGAKKADDEWGLTAEHGYDVVIGDETLGLAKFLIEDEILPNLQIKTPEEAKVKDLVADGSYPNGICMAGQAWWAHHGT